MAALEIAALYFESQKDFWKSLDYSYYHGGTCVHPNKKCLMYI